MILNFCLQHLNIITGNKIDLSSILYQEQIHQNLHLLLKVAKSAELDKYQKFNTNHQLFNKYH